MPLPVAWVPEENYHVTLRFLGDVDKQFLSRFQEFWKTESPHHTTCATRLQGTGMFPSTRQPKVLWVGLDDATQSLAALAQALERTAVKLGLPGENKPFRPHLTVGRVRSNASWSACSLPEPPALAWENQGFVLMESRLQPQRPPLYRPVHHFAF